MSIFSNMVEDTIVVFMDDFNMVGDSFYDFLRHLHDVLQICKECHLVLNWKNCHFMLKKDIELGHQISTKAIEVDRAKVKVIEKCPLPISVKGERSFLGHIAFTDGS